MDASTPPGEYWMTCAEAARRLRVNEATIRRRVYAGQIKRDAKKRVYLDEHLIEAIKTRKDTRGRPLPGWFGKSAAAIISTRRSWIRKEARRRKTEEKATPSQKRRREISALRGSGSGINTIHGLSFWFDRWEKQVGGEQQIFAMPIESRRDLLVELQRPGELYIKLKAQLDKARTTPRPPSA